MRASAGETTEFREQLMSSLSAVRPVFRAVVCTVVSEAEQLDEPGWQQLEAVVESALQARPASMIRQLRMLLRAIEWLSAFRYGRRFSFLSAEKRGRALLYLQDHPAELIRSGFWGLRTLAFLGYYGRPETARAVGYTPDARGWGALG